MSRRPTNSNRTGTLVPYTSLIRSRDAGRRAERQAAGDRIGLPARQRDMVDGLARAIEHVEVVAGDGEAVRFLQARQHLVLVLAADLDHAAGAALRSEEHTSELQSLMRHSYAVF